jgi:replicative DNA helicase
MNMAIQMWLQNNTIDMIDNFTPGYNVLYFSLEMPFKPCLNRVLGRLSSNPTKLIRSAKLNPVEMEKIKKVLRFINKYPNQFEIVDIPRGATIESLELLYEEAKVLYDPKIVVIDYLGLMDYDGGEMEDWLKLGKIAEKTHEFARVHNCTVLSAVQLNRSKGAKEEDRIGLHRIGRSALIMTNANIAVQIETRPNEKSHPDMFYHLIKNRDGELGRGRLLKNLACGTLIDDKVEEDPTTFEMRDIDDISEKIELLDI